MYILDMIYGVSGFFYSVFSGLGALALTTVGDFAQYGFNEAFSNPFTSYIFEFNVANSSSFFAEFLADIVELLGADPYRLTFLEFTIWGVVSIYALVLAFKFVALFIPNTEL